jgi:hypothetical protein
MHSADVLGAVEEVARQALLGLAPLAIAAAKSILEDCRHPGHLRAIEMVLDRTGHFARTEHKVTVEHSMDTARLEEIALRMAKELGVAPEAIFGPNRDLKQIEGVVEIEPEGVGDAAAARASPGCLATTKKPWPGGFRKP